MGFSLEKVRRRKDVLAPGALQVPLGQLVHGENRLD